MKRRILSFVLALLLCSSLFAVPAAAEDVLPYSQEDYSGLWILEDVPLVFSAKEDGATVLYMNKKYNCTFTDGYYTAELPEGILYPAPIEAKCKLDSDGKVHFSFTVEAGSRDIVMLPIQAAQKAEFAGSWALPQGSTTPACFIADESGARLAFAAYAPDKETGILDKIEIYETECEYDEDGYYRSKDTGATLADGLEGYPFIVVRDEEGSICFGLILCGHIMKFAPSDSETLGAFTGIWQGALSDEETGEQMKLTFIGTGLTARLIETGSMDETDVAAYFNLIYGGPNEYIYKMDGYNTFTIRLSDNGELDMSSLGIPGLTFTKLPQLKVSDYVGVWADKASGITFMGNVSGASFVVDGKEYPLTFDGGAYFANIERFGEMVIAEGEPQPSQYVFVKNSNGTVTELMTDTTILPSKHDHKDADGDGLCDVCGEKMPNTSSLIDILRNIFNTIMENIRNFFVRIFG